ncbi:MAG: hypothetical protein OXG76_12550 [Acidimicrobiaceae bacterium]|nr:hypothetical protein [Acidimicrobiaceae bacterium]
MIDLRDKARILDKLGDKVLEAIAASVAGARGDYRQYQTSHPDFVAQASSRGLANWIHDRLWHHLSALLSDTDDIFLIERGATKEVVVGHRFRIRAKRHAPPAQVSTYPTPTALAFFQQPPDDLVLAGFEEIRLVAGYLWLGERAEIGPPVLSLRDGQGNVQWVHELPESDAAGVPASVTTLPPLDEPEEPAVRSRLVRLDRETTHHQQQ